MACPAGRITLPEPPLEPGHRAAFFAAVSRGAGNCVALADTPIAVAGMITRNRSIAAWEPNRNEWNFRELARGKCRGFAGFSQESDEHAKHLQSTYRGER